MIFADLTHGRATDSVSENLGNQTTASISPTSGSLVIVAVGSNHPSGTPNAPTISGLSMTWTQIATRLETTANQMRITLFRGFANGNSGTLTISHGGQNQQNIYWGVVQISGALMTGTNAADAIVQSAGNSGNGTGITSASVTLGAFSSERNATFGAIYQNTAQGDNPGSGFTEIGEITAAHSLETEYKLTNDTGVDWTTGSNMDDFVAIALEIKPTPQVGNAMFFGNGVTVS